MVLYQQTRSICKFASLSFSWVYCSKLFKTMGATSPTAGSTHSLGELRARSLDPVASRLWLLGGDNPADPFIARERRNIPPC